MKKEKKSQVKPKKAVPQGKQEEKSKKEKDREKVMEQLRALGYI